MHRAMSLCIGLVAVVCGLATALPAHAQPTGYDGYQVVRITVADPAELELLRALEGPGRDFELWSEVLAPGPVEFRVAPAGLPLLRASGLRYEVLIPDLQAHLDELFGGDRGGDFFDKLRTYDEHVQFMRDLVAVYPDLAEMFELGRSVQGRSMWALRITGKGKVKPGILYHGAIHGNEQAAASVVAYVAHNLLTKYAKDPEITALVDQGEWYLLPIMNVDGYVRYQRYNAHDVDLNRNFDGPGAGKDPHGGPYPFSEPETQHVRDFIESHPKVRVYVDLHGYVPWIMWVWGHIPDYCKDHELFYSVGSVFRDRIEAAGGGRYTIGTIWQVAYPTSGCSTNYGYGVAERWAWGIEVQHPTMPKICQEFVSSMFWLGEWIWTYDCNGNGIKDSEDIKSGTSKDLNKNGVPDECDGLGDLNCDGELNVADIDPFVLALSDPAAYQKQFPDCPLAKRDINGDGEFDFKDIDPFVTLLSAP